MMAMSVLENATLPSLRQFGRWAASSSACRASGARPSASSAT